MLLCQLRMQEVGLCPSKYVPRRVQVKTTYSRINQVSNASKRQPSGEQRSFQIPQLSFPNSWSTCRISSIAAALSEFSSSSEWHHPSFAPRCCRGRRGGQKAKRWEIPWSNPGWEKPILHCRSTWPDGYRLDSYLLYGTRCLKATHKFYNSHRSC